MTNPEIAHQRLHNQQIGQNIFTHPAEVVRWLGAVQAQDYLASLWAVGIRLEGASEASVEQAIADRTILRTWPMRGTIHYVPAEDARWMLELLTPRVIASSAGRYRQLELDEVTFAKSAKVLEKALEGGPVMRKNLLFHLQGAGISTEGQRGIHILGHWAQKGLICLGPRQGKQPTFVLLNEWVKKPAIPEPDEALALLTQRYFLSHGPATLQDFVWWAGLTARDAARGVELAGESLAKIALGDQTYWTNPTKPKPITQSALLLPWFDEFLVAYKDRSAILDLKHLKHVNAGGGMLNPTIVIDGQVVGVWKRTLTAKAVKLELEPFQPLTQTKLPAIKLAAQRYGAFLGKAVELI
jgi:hypothetical protein